MLIEDIIAERQADLTASDRRLVDVLLTDKTEGSFLAAHEIAERAGVHPSTAGRLARKLGFKSYRHMRDELRNAVLSDLDASRRIRKRVDRAVGQTLLQSVVEGEIQALSGLVTQVDQPTIDASTEWLREARRIVVMGESHASSLAEIFVRRLKRSGYRAVAVPHLDWEAADELISLTSEDLLFGMIFRHRSTGIERAFRIASETKARTILLTDRVAAPRAGITMTVRRGEVGEFHSLTVPMAICNTLILELSTADRGHSLEALAKLEHLRCTFEGTRNVRRKR